MVKDGKKIVDYQCREIFAKGTKILPEDIAIMSLFKDLLDKAKSIDLIIVNNKSDDCNSLIRTFIEEYLYLRFILKENTSLRGKAYYLNYKLKGLKKIEKYLENVVDNDSKK